METVNTTNTMLAYSIYRTFETQTKYNNKYIKDTLQSIYNRLKIDRKAKATDLNKYFELKPCKTNNRENGKILKSF